MQQFIINALCNFPWRNFQGYVRVYSSLRLKQMQSVRIATKLGTVVLGLIMQPWRVSPVRGI